MRRRQLLQAVGATGIATATAGCAGLWEDERPPPPEPTESPTGDPSATSTARPPHADRFGTVVDLVEAGADPEANESIVPLLKRHLADDTLLYLPAGRYLMDDTVRHLAFDNVGIVGDDAVIVPPDGFDVPFFDMGRPGRASNLLFEGVTFDFRADDTGSRPLSALVDDGLLVRDVAVTGTQDAGRAQLRADVTHPEGTGVVERLRLPDGATERTGASGCFVGDQHRGDLRVADCLMVGFPDNGLYADPTDGRVEVVGGYYANSDISNVRVGNDSVVRGVHVRCDAAPETYENMRGIRLTHGDGVLVEDCTIELSKVAASGGAITVGDRVTSATVRNTAISVDADGINAIRISTPLPEVSRDGRLAFEDLTVRGSAANRATVEVGDQKNCTFDRCSIVQTGANRDGFLFRYSSSGVIRDSRIDVTGRPVVSADRSSVRVVNSKPPGVNTDPSESDG